MERRVPFALKIPSLWPSCGGEGNELIGRISAVNEKLSADNFCNDARAAAGKNMGAGLPRGRSMPGNIPQPASP
ncbi:hypothetical protein J4729_11305 [Leisingera sp. HS039]|uniref:hypothetical protein n=1 Tax=unclassified Leisingera TaxID=2614906 RepID=UPI001070EF70|nr:MULTISPECIES: hypothetical protein [unclassified Leisingera]MBQ4825128.1 hypothetical protein [Leisingera sp. HS039]QBR38660.1 hypothetical protein ETW23_22510 [Leisingera sp. NJS201]